MTQKFISLRQPPTVSGHNVITMLLRGSNCRVCIKYGPIKFPFESASPSPSSLFLCSTVAITAIRSAVTICCCCYCYCCRRLHLWLQANSIPNEPKNSQTNKQTHHGIILLLTTTRGPVAACLAVGAAEAAFRRLQLGRAEVEACSSGGYGHSVAITLFQHSFGVPAVAGISVWPARHQPQAVAPITTLHAGVPQPART